jgi:1-aminocyclopropane-1-carboxylate deaminase
LRLDLIDPEISGNKWFKLKHNLQKASEGHFKTLITFGGVNSNHIAATAKAGKKAGIKTIGIIRGEQQQISPTLAKAQADAMQIEYISRSDYTQKNSFEFTEALNKKYGPHYLVPEGGNNLAGAMGCTEILNEECRTFDYIICACGTGTTYAGLLNSAAPNQIVIGINVLKGENTLPASAIKLLSTMNSQETKEVIGNEALDKETIIENCISNNYCFSGYACYSKELVDYKKEFEKRCNFELDYVYTNKLFYAVSDLIKKKKFKKNSKLLLIHSGGLQGNVAFEQRYHLKLIR